MSETASAKAFNLDDLDTNLVEETVELNPTSDPFAGPPPVPDGVHRLKLSIKADSWQQKETNPKKGGNPQTYYKCDIIAKVVAEGEWYNNFTLRRTSQLINTLTFQGKNSMAWIISKCGVDDNVIKEANTARKLAILFRDTLASEPIVKGKTQWQTSRSFPDPDDPTRTKYEVFKYGMKQHPQDKGSLSGYNPTVYDSVTEEEFRAQPVIVEFYEDN